MSFENHENRNQRRVEASDAQSRLTQEALTLYQCGPGGAIVTNPADCREQNSRSLPNLELFDPEQRRSLTG